MEKLKNGLLVVSLLANVAAVIFIIMLTKTSYLDVPLAAYSHQKNCVQDFDSVLKTADKLPADSRDQAKQLYATLVCQKDYQTGQSLTGDNFSALFQQLTKSASASASGSQ
jgi:hypothetical protein